jgi:hypothetical protein
MGGASFVQIPCVVDVRQGCPFPRLAVTAVGLQLTWMSRFDGLNAASYGEPGVNTTYTRLIRPGARGSCDPLVRPKHVRTAWVIGAFGDEGGAEAVSLYAEEGTGYGPVDGTHGAGRVRGRLGGQ